MFFRVSRDANKIYLHAIKAGFGCTKQKLEFMCLIDNVPVIWFGHIVCYKATPVDNLSQRYNS